MKLVMCKEVGPLCLTKMLEFKFTVSGGLQLASRINYASLKAVGEIKYMSNYGVPL